MSCRELERLFVAGAEGEAQADAHRKTCGVCARTGADIDETHAMTSALVAPPFSPALRRSLLDIPRMTVSCEGAEPLLAAALEGVDEISAEDRRRLDSHLSRCAGCTASANVLASMRDLALPEPPPWLTTRLAATRPARPVSPWRRLLSARAFVAYAYAAALLVMIMGWNPTDVVRKAGFAKLGESTRNVVTVAQSSVVDRLGALQEKAARKLAVWKGHVGGYGRAAVSNALAIVARPESRKTPSRPRLSKEGATSTSDFSSAAHAAGREPFPRRFRV